MTYDRTYRNNTNLFDILNDLSMNLLSGLFCGLIHSIYFKKIFHFSVTFSFNCENKIVIAVAYEKNEHVSNVKIVVPIQESRLTIDPYGQ